MVAPALQFKCSRQIKDPGVTASVINRHSTLRLDSSAWKLILTRRHKTGSLFL
ncbi:hypothetical protein H6F73_05500 [Microcoleus sp. FACHB-68]|nr:hypothetical protein [Microcoleus sp. FACHB-68]